MGEKQVKQPSKPTNLLFRFVARIQLILANITLEPVMFLITFSSSLDDISVTQMNLEKCCKYEFMFNDTVCDNLVTDFKEQNELVQNENAQFGVYQSIVSSVFPIFFSFYIGAWCDLFGRKVCMLLFFYSKIISQIIVIILAYYMEWPKEWYLASLVPTAIVGGYSAISMGLNAYISDISKPDLRAFRMGMIHLAQSLGRTVASPVGAYLLKTGGYVCVTSASLLGILLGALFITIKLRNYKWTPSPNQQMRNPFSLYHVQDAMKTTFKRREGPNRKYLLILMFMMIFQIVPFFGEYNIAYYYVRNRFEWSYVDYSYYTTVVSAIGIVGQAILIPSISANRSRDSLVAIIVISSTITRHLIKGFSSKGWMYYLAAIVDLLGSYSLTLTRAMLTCCVPLTEFGKIYAVLSALEYLLPMGVTQLYTIIWKETQNTVPGAAFFMSAGLSSVALCLGSYVHFSLKGKRFSEVVYERKSEKEKFEEKKYLDPPPSYLEAHISYI